MVRASAAKICFVGLPLGALLLLADGHDLVYVGVGRKGAIGSRRLVRRLGSRVRMLPDLRDPEEVARIRLAAPDLLVSWYFPKNVPAAVRALAPSGSVGIHPSLLPRHRGPDPFFWAIDSGDATTGVTAHRLADDYDTGAVLAVRELAIDPAWTAWTLAKKLDRPSLALLREVVAKLVRGQAPVERRQDEAAATLAPEPHDDELELDWELPTERLLRRIRAAAPWPGAFTFLGEDAITVTIARPAANFPRALEPGEAFLTDEAGETVAAVRTGDGAVVLLGGRRSPEEAPGSPGDREEVGLGSKDFVDLVEKLRRLP